MTLELCYGPEYENHLELQITKEIYQNPTIQPSPQRIGETKR